MTTQTPTATCILWRATYLEYGLPFLVPQLPIPSTVPPPLALKIRRESQDRVSARLPLFHLSQSWSECGHQRVVGLHVRHGNIRRRGTVECSFRQPEPSL